MLRTSGYHWAEYAPHPALAGWISSYWTVETSPGPHVLRTLPDACIDLTLQLGSKPRAHVAGAQRRARRWDLQGPMHLLGARLLPGAAALLGIVASELGDEWTPLETLLPRAGVSRLVRDAASSPSTERRVAVLEAFLSERLLNRGLDPRLSAAIHHVFTTHGNVSVASLARHSGAHARTLSRLFDQALGLSPKRFARIVRLQAALRALPGSDNWARVAAELGYHDQAHFIHDVRELFGTTPGQLVALAPKTR
jgi:AraC-like DNA-binding protein